MTIEDVDADDRCSTSPQEVEQLAFRLGRGRDDGAGYRPRSHGDYLPRSPARRRGEPAVAAPRLGGRRRRADGRLGVEAHGTFGAAYEGPPGYVHGGWIALAFDEMLGIANIAAGHPGMTARLTVHYRKPTPLFRELRFRAWVDRVEGRRIMSRAEVWDGDTLTAEADGLFVQPRPDSRRTARGQSRGPKYCSASSGRGCTNRPSASAVSVSPS